MFYSNSPDLYIQPVTLVKDGQIPARADYRNTSDMDMDKEKAPPGWTIILNHLTRKPILVQKNLSEYTEAVEMHPELAFAEIEGKDLSGVS